MIVLRAARYLATFAMFLYLVSLATCGLPK